MTSSLLHQSIEISTYERTTFRSKWEETGNSSHWAMCVFFLFYAYISIERPIGVMTKRRREMHNNKKKSPFRWMYCREMLYNTVRRRSEIQSIGLVLLAEFEGNVQRRNSWPRTMNGTGDFSSILTLSAAYVQRLHHNDLSSVAANERRRNSLSLSLSCLYWWALIRTEEKITRRTPWGVRHHIFLF